EITLGKVKEKFKKHWPGVSGSALLEDTDYSKPVYGMPSYQDGSINLKLTKDAKYFDEFDISVHPEGSYKPEPKSVEKNPDLGPLTPHLAAGCDERVDDS